MKWVVLLSLGFLGFSCTKMSSREGIDPRDEVKASAHISDSFHAEKLKTPAQASLKVDQAHVSLAHSALGKEFLLSTNLLTQAPTPLFLALQSRVVSFILRDQKVYLMDVTGNFTVGQGNIPQNLLIAEFPVLKDSNGFITIDFNAGMKQIITTQSMYGSDDDPAAAKDPQYKLPVNEVGISYLDEVTLKNEALYIRQVAQMEQKSKDDVTQLPIEVRYQIKPYLPNPEFTPMLSPGFDKVGFFEANPLLLKDGSSRIYSMKWDDKKPIVFSISANTPEKYRALVRDSLLYWNKILGENKVQVVQLEDKSVTAPAFDQNIIQWVDWDNAGYAFADAHVDPRSGEVTSAQIFMPSAFLHSNVPKKVRNVIVTDPGFTLKGFKSARLCSRNILQDVSAREDAPATPELMQKALFGYVYEVIAHEMGHVLGLRHNFAASLATNYDFKDRKDLILGFYKNGSIPDSIVPSNSVMEYSRFEESSWNGVRFQNGGAPLTYDQMALDFLYFQKPLPETNRPLFCTDSQIATYIDCNMNDEGRSVVSMAAGQYQLSLETIATRLLNVYINASKFPDHTGDQTIPVSGVSLDASAQAKAVVLDLAKLMSSLKAGSKFIAVRSALMPIRAQDEEKVQQLEKDYVAAEFARLGGIENLLAAIPQSFEAQLNAKFASILENPFFNSGISENGAPWAFTDDEKAAMKAQVQVFAPQLKEQLILNEIKALSGENFDFSAAYGQSPSDDKAKWVDSSLTDALAPVLFGRFQQYAFAKTDEKIATDVTLKDGTHSAVDLPTYVYSQDVREAAASLLSNGHEAIEWGFVEKNKMDTLVSSELELIGDADKIDLTSLNKNTLKWYLGNKKIESILQPQ